MKNLNQFIIERLKLTKDSKLQKQQYKYFPKDFNELRSLLEQLLKERGKDADLNDIDVSQVTTFYDKDKKIKLFGKLDPHNIDISEWDVSNVTDMHGMFYECKNFTGQGLENWDVSNVEDMGYMFAYCIDFNCDLSKWDVSNIKNMSNMFTWCAKFTGQGLENWDVSNVKDMDWMFSSCTNFTGQVLENWNVSKVKDMYYMFYKCKNFNCDLSQWDVSGVKYMNYMFDGCDSLKNKPKWYKE